MILTVTANASLDNVIFIDEFIPTTTMRTHQAVESVGGKGFDTSVVLQTLGADNIAVGIVAGEVGKRVARLLDGYGIKHDLVWVEGETRIAHVIVETKPGRDSHITVGATRVKPADVDTFHARIERHLDEASWVVCAGSIPEGMPKDIYATITAKAHQKGRAVLIDCPSEPMTLALSQKPDIAKMNRAEFSQTFGIQIDSMEELVRVAQDVRDRYELPGLVITCGVDGILAVTSQGCHIASSPPQKVKNTAGAGDAASGALAWRLSLGDDWSQALGWAAAASAAVVLTEGTADCRIEDVNRILPEIKVDRLG
jgi:1-phosphofructokinase family hexose kinase